MESALKMTTCMYSAEYSNAGQTARLTVINESGFAFGPNDRDKL
jgi:hypothetical protein